MTGPSLRLVLERRPDLDGRVRLAGSIRLAGVEHHLTTVDARLYAAALGRLFNAPLLAWSSGSGALARDLGLGRFHLVPDGLAEFSVDGRSFAVAIEVDCGTEPHSVFVGAPGKPGKLSRYRSAWKAGALGALWIVVSGGGGRRRSLEHLVSDAGLRDFAFVIDRSTTTARPVTALAGGGEASRLWTEGPNGVLATDQNAETNRSVSTPIPTAVGTADGWAVGRGRLTSPSGRSDR